MKTKTYQHERHGSVIAACCGGKTLFPLSAITGIHKLGTFGREWIESYAEKHSHAPIKPKNGNDRMLAETTVLDFITTLIDDTDLVDWLINGVIKDLHGITEPPSVGSLVPLGHTQGEPLTPSNSVSAWLLHQILAPHVGYAQWLRSWFKGNMTGLPVPGHQVGRRSDGTIALSPILALGLARKTGSCPARIAAELIQNLGLSASDNTLTTVDSMLRRHAVTIQNSKPEGRLAARQ